MADKFDTLYEALVALGTEGAAKAGYFAEGGEGGVEAFTVNGKSPVNGNIEVGTVRKVNGVEANAAGEVVVPTVVTVNGVEADGSGNVAVGTVRTVNGASPDAQGAVTVAIPDITPVTVNNIAVGTATLTMGTSQKDKLNILRTTDEVVVTLPPNLGTDTKPYTAMIVNADGNMKVVGGDGVEIVSFADVAVKGVTLGLLNTGTTWVVIGTR
ncbi:hypothetical protein QE332_gp101 [Pseudomonas phage vB_PaeM_LCK69]|uniref:Uncharacterized protein n=1 Tax=Pseudomonas phage vB_PaeM_LCK69 TaxID=2488595 RepID=A0A3G8F5B5_9CAUD|nr:hypothetical protein QE332_gp101 [Pseudomonas phage vB_PaeM_LCK69]AZF89712.1 hypothetical protein [Pseudomonas phage vB_PaeM_LCK69]